MTTTTALLAVALGLGAGVLAGLFGVGGGIVFVPTLLALGLGQLDAEATSLLAIIPTVAAGTWRHSRYGHVRWRPAAALGVASIAGVALGSWLAVSTDETLLRRLFGLLVLAVAVQIAWQALRRPPSGST